MKWLLEPTQISLDLSAFDSQKYVDDLQLSRNTRKNLLDAQVTHLFPVQVAVMQRLLLKDSSWNDLFRKHTSGQHPGDLLVSAPTGSGKTLAYVIPIVETLLHRRISALRALIVLPTKDLVTQVKSTFDAFVRGTDLRVYALNQLSNDGISMLKCDILITTPGRLVDHLKNTPKFTLQHLQWFVADEADRLLNQSYNNWLELALESVDCSFNGSDDELSTIRDRPGQHFYPHCESDSDQLSKQDSELRSRSLGASLSQLQCVTHMRKLLFSATLTRHPAKLSALKLTRPHIISAMPTHVQSQQDVDDGKDVSLDLMNDEEAKYALPATLKQEFIVCDDTSEKPLLLLSMILKRQLSGCLVFVRSVEHAENLCQIIKRYLQSTQSSVRTEYFASTLTTNARTQIINQFQSNQIQILICTDALARGMDFNNTTVKTVVNYDPPTVIKTYVHRSGRTARAGNEGTVVSILSQQECRHWKKMMREFGVYGECVRLPNKLLRDEPEFIESYTQCLQQLKGDRK